VKVLSSSTLFNNSVGLSVVCIHFTIFFRFTFTAAPASLTVVRKRTNYTSYVSSRDHSLPGTKVPKNIRSQERKFLQTFVPGSEGSHWELSLLGAKSPDTVWRSPRPQPPFVRMSKTAPPHFTRYICRFPLQHLSAIYTLQHPHFTIALYFSLAGTKSPRAKIIHSET